MNTFFLKISWHRFLPSPFGVLSAFLAATLYTLALPPYSYSFLGWIALTPLAFYIAYRKPSVESALTLGFLFGVGQFLSSLYWLTTLTWAGWGVLSLYLALYYALWGGYWVLITQRIQFTIFQNITYAIYGTGFWVGLEWLRGTLLTGFGWNGLGVTQVSTLSIIQIADLGGVYAVSWVVAFVSIVFALALGRIIQSIKNNQVQSAHPDLYIALLAICLTFAYGAYRISHPPTFKTRLTITCIQPSITQDPWGNAPEQSAFQKLLDITQQSTEFYTPQLLIWPESITGGSALDNGLFHRAIDSLFQKSPHLNLLTGSLNYEGLHVYNSAMLFQKNTSSVQVYNKQHLVPFGEFIPFSKWAPWFGQMIGVGSDFSSGKELGLFRLHDADILLSPLICFEDTIPSLVRDAALKNPDLFINVTNDGWFKESAANKQHFHNAIFRAIEFRKPLVRCSNNGITATVSPLGVVNIFCDPEEKSVYRSGYLFEEILIPQNSPTPYLFLGNWVPIISLILAFLGLVIENLRKKFE